MGQTVTAAVTVPRSASSSLRFLGLLKQPTDSDQNPNPRLTCPLELDERDDVFWSPSSSSSSSPADGSARSASHLGGGGGGGRPRPFVPEPRGLSAALGDDGGGSGGSPVRRLSAARVTRPVPVPGAAAAAVAVAEAVLRVRQSAPVVVPAWPKRTSVRREKREREREEGEEEEEEEEEEREEEEEEEEVMVPPHVMVGRAHEMTFSVVEGAGRTLKGRDLRRVRNAVLERTGFLEDLD